MKKITLFCFLACLFCYSELSARSTPLNEYNWDPKLGRGAQLDAYGNPIKKGKEIKACMEKCEGYSTEISSCDEGYELVSCEADGCSSLYKCVETPCDEGFDTTLKNCMIEVQETNYLCTKCID